MANFNWVPEGYEGRFSYVNNKLVASCLECGATRYTSGKGAVLKDIAAGRGEKFRLCGIHGNYKGGKPSKEDIASWPEGHKRCYSCKDVLPFEKFGKHSAAMFGYDTTCRECRKPRSKQQWKDKPYKSKMYDRAKTRSTALGREFTITMDDFDIPEECPVFKRPFEYTPGSPWVPSIDRIDSNKGYVPGNITVMSWRANALKNDITLYEVLMLAEYMKDTSLN